MTVNSIGGMDVSDHLTLPGVKNRQLNGGEIRMTLGGRVHVDDFPLEVGHQLFLTDDGDHGLFTGAQIDQLNVWRLDRTRVVFVHHLGTWTVIVEKVNVEQAEGYADPDDTDDYYGTITLRIME